MIATSEGVIQFINHTNRMSDEKVIGKKFYDFINPKYHKLVKEKITHTLKTGEVNYYELKGVGLNEEESWYFSRIGAIKKNDKIVGIISITSDITEKKKAEKIIKQKLEKLKEIETSKTEFLNTISHELKTPLTAISAHLEIIENSEKNCNCQIYCKKPECKKQIKSSIQTSIKNVKQLEILINNILELSKLESKSFELNFIEIDLKQEIKKIINNLNVLAIQKNIQLMFDEKDSSFVIADLQMIQKILNNLILNAIKFTEEGEIVIKLKKQEDNILISILDTGIGISKEEQDKIFDKFYQVDSSLRRKYEGSGLGLSITKKLIELHSSKLNVESEFGKGTTFSFTLPIKIEKGGITKMKKILYVEDNEDTAQAVKIMLDAAGFETEIALSGKEGLEKAEQHFDLILLDIMLPDMSGWDIFTKLKAKNDSKYAFLSVIPVSYERMNELKKSGVSDYITKPFQREDLIERIKKILKPLETNI